MKGFESSQRFEPFKTSAFDEWYDMAKYIRNSSRTCEDQDLQMVASLFQNHSGSSHIIASDVSIRFRVV